MRRENEYIDQRVDKIINKERERNEEGGIRIFMLQNLRIIA